MKILYLLFSFTVGGTEKLIVDVCNEMVRNGNSVYLYIVNDKYDKDLLSTINPDVNIILKNRASGKGSKINAIIELSKFIRDNKISVLHCNSFDSPELVILKPIYFPKTKIIYTVHGMNQYNKLSKFRVLYRNIICNRIIAISNSVKQELISSGASKNKVEVVYNAINTEKYIDCRKKHKSSNQLVIGNVARLDPATKGQDLLIRAAGLLHEKYPNISYRFAGGAPNNDIIDQLYNLAEKVGISNNIEFLGNVEDIPSFLSTIDLFVLPSRSEGFGISLIEAMSAGIPCIASDTGGPKEIIGNNERGILFHNGNYEDLAKCISEVIVNFDKYSKLAKCQQPYVSEHFDIKSMCMRLTKIYNCE